MYIKGQKIKWPQDNKGVIRRRKSKDIQYNGLKAIYMTLRTLYSAIKKIYIEMRVGVGKLGQQSLTATVKVWILG